MSPKPPPSPRNPDSSHGAPEDLRAAIEAARRNPNLNLGRVVLLEELGRGGMGVVYRGWQEDLRSVVAVKVLTGGTDEKDRARFMREARVASKLRHPNIVPVHEAGEAGGRCYFRWTSSRADRFSGFSRRSGSTCARCARRCG